MRAMASQITSLTIVYSTVYSGANQRKHQSSASLAFVRGIHRWPVNFPHKGPVARKKLPFDDVIMRRISIMDAEGCNADLSILSLFWADIQFCLKCERDADGRQCCCIFLYHISLYFIDLKILSQATHSQKFVWKGVIIWMLMPHSKVLYKPTRPPFNLVQHIYIHSFWRKQMNKTARAFYIYPCIPVQYKCTFTGIYMCLSGVNNDIVFFYVLISKLIFSYRV